jgi:hypothetical protein
MVATLTPCLHNDRKQNLGPSAIRRSYQFDAPLGFAAGDENLHRYVSNGPTNATDPSGLQQAGGQILPKPRYIITADGAVHDLDAGKIDQGIVDRIEKGEIKHWKGSQIVGFADRDGKPVSPKERPLRVTPAEKERERELQERAKRTKEQHEAIEEFVKDWAGPILDLLPAIGGAKGIDEAIEGKEIVTGYELSTSDRCIAAAGVVPGGKWIGKGIKGGWRLLKRVLGWGARHADEAADAAGAAARNAGRGGDAAESAGDAAKTTGKGKLRDRLGTPPAGMKNPQAHHDLPRKHREKFEDAGLDIDDPAHGRWVEGTPPGKHQNWSKKFNDEWDKFFDGFEGKQPPTAKEILDKKNELVGSGRFN